MGFRDENRLIRDRKRRDFAYPLDKFENEKPCFKDTVLVAPLISTVESSRLGEVRYGQNSSNQYCPIRPRKETIRGSLFVFNDITMKDFIMQSICPIRK